MDANGPMSIYRSLRRLPRLRSCRGSDRRSDRLFRLQTGRALDARHAESSNFVENDRMDAAVRL